MKIRFLIDQVYETGGPGVGPKFSAGEYLSSDEVGEKLGVADPSPDFVEAFLNRWVQRNLAVWAEDQSTEIVEPKADEPEDLSSLTRAQLDALAAERGVDVSDARNKGDVIAALELAAEADAAV
jgi:hypothetical protein